MSTPVLRSAVNVVRRSHQFKPTWLTTTNTQTRSVSSLNFCLSKNDGNDGFMKGMLCTANLDVHSLAISQHPSTEKRPALTDMLLNISGNPVLIATGYTQNALGGEEFISYNDVSGVNSLVDMAASKLEELSVWLISTLKRRKKMMNKHKLRKRKKKMRLKTRK
eukprot:scaffold8367_cov91-Cyclotella_meneghiniana.AAC.7